TRGWPNPCSPTWTPSATYGLPRTACTSTPTPCGTGCAAPRRPPASIWTAPSSGCSPCSSCACRLRVDAASEAVPGRAPAVPGAQPAALGGSAEEGRVVGGALAAYPRPTAPHRVPGQLGVQAGHLAAEDGVPDALL